MNKKYQLVSEAVGEYEKYDSEMGSFWKTVLNKIRSSLEETMPTRSIQLPKEEALIKSKFRNLNVEVRLNSTPDVNAWVIPGIQEIKQLGNLGLLGWAYYLRKAWPVLLKLRLTQTKPGPNKTVVFPKSKVKYLIFVTKGLLTHFEPEERLAIYLHEIGHWWETSKDIPRQLRHIEKERSISNVAWFINVLGHYARRWKEYEADYFAIRSGYGEELKSAMGAFSRKRKQKMTWLIKLADWSMRQNIEFQNKEEERHAGQFGGSNYPSMKQRQDQVDVAKEKGKEYERNPA